MRPAKRLPACRLWVLPLRHRPNGCDYALRRNWPGGVIKTSVVPFLVFTAVASATRSTHAHAPPLATRSQRRMHSNFMRLRVAGAAMKHGTNRRAVEREVDARYSA